VPKSGLEALGGEWANLAPFAGDENALYEWISDPALWAQVVLGDLDSGGTDRRSRPASRAPTPFDEDEDEDDEPALTERKAAGSRSQLRLAQLHSGFRDALDADGFVLWRSFPALGPSHLVLRQVRSLCPSQLCGSPPSGIAAPGAAPLCPLRVNPV